MKHLYEVDHCVTYWVVADDERDAIMQAQNWELATGNTETETLSEASVTSIGRDKAEKVRFRFEGEDETCSMWFAYMIVRDHGSTVLACSEW